MFFFYFDKCPNMAAIITFFIVHRAEQETIEIISVHKTFQDKNLVSQPIQVKNNIPPDTLEHELEAILEHFADGVEENTGYRITWHQLDLTGKEKAEQLIALCAWEHLTLQPEPTSPSP